MVLWRKLALLAFVFCVAAGGPGIAMPVVSGSPAAMADGCDDMAEATSDSGTPSEPASHDCCPDKGCACVVAHGVALFAALPAASIVLPLERTATRFASQGYASPALARLIRPPIS